MRLRRRPLLLLRCLILVVVAVAAVVVLIQISTVGLLSHSGIFFFTVSFTLITEFAICTSLLRFKTRSGLSRALNRERLRKRKRQRKKEEKDGNEVGLGFKGKNKTCKHFG
jgi:hypothetical protein